MWEWGHYSYRVVFLARLYYEIFIGLSQPIREHRLLIIEDFLLALE